MAFVRRLLVVAVAVAVAWLLARVSLIRVGEGAARCATGRPLLFPGFLKPVHDFCTGKPRPKQNLPQPKRTKPLPRQAQS